MIAFALLLSLTLQTPPAPRDLDVPADAHEPELAVGDDGVVALVCATKSVVHVLVSKDRGASFVSSSQVGVGGVLSVGQRRGPKVALAGERVCVTVIGGAQGGGKDGDVLAFTRTIDGGAWPKSVRVNSVEGSAREGLHALASGPKNELFCAWIDLRESEPQVMGALSIDGGVTWSENRRISAPAGSKLCPCCSPSVAIDRDGTVYATWRSEKDGARDLVLAQSRDAFATPVTSVTKLGRATWKIEMCPMDGGSVRAAGDDVLAIWRSDSTVFVGSPRALDKEERLGDGMQPVLAIGLHAHALWSDRLGGRLLAREIGRELAADAVRELAPEATAVVIASSPTRGKGPVIAAWETSYAQGRKLQVLRVEP